MKTYISSRVSSSILLGPCFSPPLSFFLFKYGRDVCGENSKQRGPWDHQYTFPNNADLLKTVSYDSSQGKEKVVEVCKIMSIPGILDQE